MRLTQPVMITMSAIVAIGFTLAMLAPHQLEVGELVLLASCIVLMRERRMVKDEYALPYRSAEPIAASSIGWFGGSAPSGREAGPHASWSTAAPNSTLESPYGGVHSVEQIAHEMLGHAFRRA